MTSLELNDDQAGVLRECLQSEVSDLSMEIADTDNFDFRQGLKARRVLLQEILEQLTSLDEQPTTGG